MVTETRLKLDEFLALPDIDERRLELIDGEIYEKVSPRWGHSRFAIELGIALRPFGFVGAEPRAIIPDSPDRGPSAPLPDLAMYREKPPRADEWMTNPPDLAVEFLSLGQSRREMRTKVDMYLAFGMKCVWVFDLERRSVDAYEGGERRTLRGSDQLVATTIPGFADRVDELYERSGFKIQ